MRRTRALIASSLAVLAIAACRDASQPAKPSDSGVAPTRRLVLLATGDVGSDTDVCGCRAHPLGGVARRAQVVREAEAADPGRVLVLDAGDLFFRTWNISPRYEPQARETAAFLADAQRMMGAAAMTVGERDLALGIPLLRQLAERGGFLLTSSNLVFTESGTTAFARYQLVERGGVKIGIVGAAVELNPDAPAFEVYRHQGLEARPAGPALAEAAQAARAAGAELVVGLLHLPEQRVTEVLAALPPRTIDVALVAHDRIAGRFRVMPGGSSALWSVGDRGKYVAKVVLEIPVGPARSILDIGALAAQSEQIAALDERIAAYHAEDAGVLDPHLAARLKTDRAETIARLTRRREQLAAELDSIRTGGVITAKSELVELPPTRAEDPTVLSAYRAYQERLHVVNAGVPAPNRAELEYVGNPSCKSCHAEEYTQWKTTGHARAWATMERTRQTGNLDCVPCHSTGFERPGGPARLADLKPFVDVGCESCHGAGSAHAQNPKIELDFGKVVPERVCAECHRAQADQKPFDFEERLPKVLGKGHRASR